MHWALIIYTMPRVYGVLKEHDVIGEIFLLKNNKVIRQKKFFKRYDRKQLMNEYMSICKLNTKNSYSIDIKLDI
jgi:hypothetical protein